MPFLAQNICVAPSEVLLPLSVMMLCGTPKRKTIDLIKLIAAVESWVVTGAASTHLVNLSTATSI